MEKSNTNPSPQETLTRYVGELEEATRDTIALFGLTGLSVQVNPGAGWSSAKTADKVILTIDPLQITTLNRGDKAQEELTVEEMVDRIAGTDKTFIRHTICHELGHVSDFVDPSHEDEVGTSKSDHFFWNIIDDAIIDKRLRNIPTLDDCTDELYGSILFPADSYIEQPKNVQLMYGLLIGSVTGKLVEVDSEVQEIIDHLAAIELNGNSYDIMQVMASSSTSLDERRKIAERYIKPYFDTLLEEDKQNGLDNNSEEQYEQYEVVMHPGSHDHGDEGDDADGSPSEGEDGENNGFGNVHAKASELGSMLNKLNEELKGQSNDATDESKEEKGKPTSKIISGLGAGSIASELQLPEDDTYKYIEYLNEYRAEIFATAKAFETLAIPSRSKTSPRYANRPGYSGHKLHTGRIAQAEIQMQTGSEQAIWRTVEHKGKRLDYNLDKLDVHLLVDVSGSMEGVNAQQAAVTALMLMEGVELARHNLAKNNVRNQKPDVRLQVTAFGSDFQVVSPISHKPEARDKGQAFMALRDPNSSSTFVGGALATVSKIHLENPGRNQLVFIISDGGFHDYDEALKIVKSFQPNGVQIIQLIIGSPGAKTISKNASFLSDAKTMPLLVRAQLENYMNNVG